MHRCLSIPEILRTVCNELYDIGGEPPKPRELVNAVLVSRYWSVIALDCLWQKISGIHCLIRCLPNDLWHIESIQVDPLGSDDSQIRILTMKRELKDSDLEILKKYTHRVRTFICDDLSVTARPDVYEMLSLSCRPPLLPNIQILDWTADRLLGCFDEHFRYIDLFLSSRLESLRLDPDISWPHNEHSFRTIPTTIWSNIFRLDLNLRIAGRDQRPLTTVLSYLSTTLREYHQLSGFVTEDLTLDGLFALATLPRLKDLEIQHARHLWDLPSTGSDDQTDLPSSLWCLNSPFPALEAITIGTAADKPTPIVTQFFTLLKRAKISQISLQLRHQKVADGLSDLFLAIVDHCDHATLKKLKLDLHSVSHIPFSTIQPLLCFPILQVVYIHSDLASHGMTILEAEMSQLVASWPELRVLWLLPYVDEPSNTTLLAFLPLTKATRLRHLGLSLNASDPAARKLLRDSVPENYKGLRNYSLRTLEVGWSPISHGEFVANFLSEVFANLDDITALHHLEPISEDSKRWYSISTVLLPLFSDIRKRERETLGTHEVRPKELKGSARWLFEQAKEGDKDLSNPSCFGCPRTSMGDRSWLED